MTPDRTFAGPLFVFGMARSGTTYLRRLVNSLPGVYLEYESTTLSSAHDLWHRENVLASKSTFKRFIDRLHRRELRTGITPTALFTQSPEFYERLYESVREHQDLGAFCQELFRTGVAPGEIWGNKLVRRDELKLMLELFPQARFVIISRDARSVAYSMHEFFGGDYYTAAFMWADTARVIRSFQEKADKAHVLVYPYEDLVRNSRQALEQITALVGRDLPTDFSVADRAHSQSIEKWREHLSPVQVRQVEEICYDELKHFGYEPEFATGPRRMSVTRYTMSIVRHSIGRLSRRRSRLLDLLTSNPLARYRKLYRQVSTRED